MKIRWTAEERAVPKMKGVIKDGVVHTGDVITVAEDLGAELIAQGLATLVTPKEGAIK